MMQFLDPVFCISSGTVDFVNGLGFVREVRDDEAVVVPGIPARVAHDLSFDDDSATVRPLWGRVERLTEEGFGLPGCARSHANFAHQASGPFLKTGIAGHSYEVLDLLKFEIIENRTRGEAAIARRTRK